jgi:glycosyltransferase involved in cell wall biosynthesis
VAFADLSVLGRRRGRDDESGPQARALDSEIAGFGVVHLHSVFLWPTWAAARSASGARVPYVISPRGMLVKQLIERRRIELVEKTNLKRAQAINVTSELEAQKLKRVAWELPPITTIPNGVDQIKNCGESKPSADVQEITAEQPLILFLGRISWKKGLDRLLHTFALTISASSRLSAQTTKNWLLRGSCGLPETSRLQIVLSFCRVRSLVPTRSIYTAQVVCAALLLRKFW